MEAITDPRITIIQKLLEHKKTEIEKKLENLANSIIQTSSFLQETARWEASEKEEAFYKNSDKEKLIEFLSKEFNKKITDYFLSNFPSASKLQELEVEPPSEQANRSEISSLIQNQIDALNILGFTFLIKQEN